MYLVLCEAGDPAGPWIQRGLEVRGVGEVALVRSPELAWASYRHEVGRGGTDLRIGLPGGRVLHLDAIQGTVNRLVTVPGDAATTIRAPDRDYVLNELNAFHLSWLSALRGPVLNRPSVNGLGGRARHLSEWVWLAAQAGLPAPPYREGSDGTPPETDVYAALPGADGPRERVLVVGDAVIGAPCEGSAAACAALARLAGAGVLGVELTRCGEGCARFAGVTTIPDLVPGGDDVLDALARALVHGEGAGR